MDRILDHVGSAHPPGTPWVAVASGRLITGTVSDLHRLKGVMSSGAEHEDAFRYALAPGTMPILCTDDNDDLRSIVEMASGREMQVVIARCGPRRHDMRWTPGSERMTFV